MSKRQKTFLQMTPAEREADVAKFDKPLPESSFKPLTAKQRALFARMKAGKPVAMRRGKLSKETVSVDLDESLLRQLDTLARRKRLTRSELIEESLRGVLALSA